MERGMQHLNLGEADSPGFTSAQAQQYSAYHRSGVGGKHEESRAHNRHPNSQEYSSQTSPSYYNNSRTGRSMDRSGGYSSPGGDTSFQVRVSPLPQHNPGHSSYYKDQSPSPRSDSEIHVPVYGSKTGEKYKYPEPAESRLVYTSPQNASFGYAQSRPMSGSSTPPPPPPPPMMASSRSYAQPSNVEPQLSPSKASSGSLPDSPKHTLERPYQLMPTMHDSSRSDGKSEKGREDEVDQLTSLLMQNMEAAADPDFFGMCAKCGRAIMGETAGCKALDQLFHVDCFTCISCSTCLKGQPFYAMEGRPYCESCYVTTLEKCSVCSKPITERILRATGKPYHPRCFVCVVCGISLDGVPFTVDATNQIHCITDFHKKFAPRCCACEQPIMPEEGNEEAVRIVAMDRNFHPGCYKCEDCGVVLTSEADGRGCYPLDEHILCKSCNAHRIQRMTNRNVPTQL